MLERSSSHLASYLQNASRVGIFNKNLHKVLPLSYIHCEELNNIKAKQSYYEFRANSLRVVSARYPVNEYLGMSCTC